jgi:hypothetical protein
MVCNKVICHLNLLRQLFWFLHRSLLLLFLKSYILPCFDYCRFCFVEITPISYSGNKDFKTFSYYCEQLFPISTLYWMNCMNIEHNVWFSHT